MILDVACCYLWLFTLYINIKIGKNSCWVLDWPVTACLGGGGGGGGLSLVGSVVVSFCAVLFPAGCLG